jgi:hypothetical protein
MREAIVNANEVAALKRKDKLFSQISRNPERYGDPPSRKRGLGFVPFCLIILERQSE